MNEQLVIKRSKENFEKEWAWLFKGLPLKHRAKLCTDSGIWWLKVSFLDSHKKSWSTEKYLLRDIFQHCDEYKKAVEAQCLHAMRLIMDSKDAKPKNEEKFTEEVSEIMVPKLVKDKRFNKLLDKYFGDHKKVRDVHIKIDVEVTV